MAVKQEFQSNSVHVVFIQSYNRTESIKRSFFFFVSPLWREAKCWVKQLEEHEISDVSRVRVRAWILIDAFILARKDIKKFKKKE
jgi:hypothetical protein